MKVIGLTGSIAMGKTVTSELFAGRGVAVFSSDAAVHRLYATGGEGVAAIGKICPQAIIDGAVHRGHLQDAIARDDSLLERVEAAIHPLVRQAEATFLAAERAKGTRLALVDIPLLFETGRQTDFDAIVVATASCSVQRARALARPGMTAERLEHILSRQLPDTEKRKRADFIVDTGEGLENARHQVDAIVDKLLK
jgi:dephospho-CoA kinase